MPRQTLKQRKDGRYKCVYKGVQFYGDTQSEALAARDAYKRQEGQKKPQDVTVMAYVLRWLPAYHDRVNRACYNQYASMLEGFCGFIGPNTPISSVTKTDITEYYNTLAWRSSSYNAKIKTLLRSLFADAVDDGLISFSPAREARPPKGTSGSHRALEPWELELVHKMINHRFGVCAMLMLYGGLRRGEVLAFDIDRDVDFEHNRIYVREAISFADGIRGTRKAPKTAAGIRSLPLFNPLREVLQGRHGAALQTDDHMPTLSMFDRVWQSYISQMETLLNGCQKRWYGKTKAQQELSASGQLPPWRDVTIRTHDFRHSFCTMCRDANVPIEVLMQWMGHSDEKMIRRIYDHVTERRKMEAEKNTAALLDGFFPEKVQTEVQAISEYDKTVEK